MTANTLIPDMKPQHHQRSLASELSKFNKPSLIKRFYCWIGIGKADEDDELARQYRACRIGIDTCTESMRDDDHG